MENPMMPFIACLILLAIAGVPWVLHIKNQKKTRSRFFDLLNGLGASGAGTERVLTHSGHRITTEYYPGSKNAPPSFSLRAEVASPGAFSLRPQSSGETFMQKIGLETDVETGDPQFDARFDIDSDESGFTAAYFASVKRREAVYALFSLGCTALEMDDRGLRADWVPFEIKETTSADFVGSSLPHLSVLAEELPACMPVQSAGGLTRKNFQFIFGALVAAGFAMGFFIFSGSMQPLDAEKLFLDSLRYSVPAYLVFILVTGMLLKGKSWFFSGLMQAVWLGLVLFPLLGYTSGAWLNAARDNSAPAAHQAQVLRKTSHRSRNSTSYYAHVRSWRSAGGVERLAVSEVVYGLLQPGRSVAVAETKPGYYGYEFGTWLYCIYSPQP